MKAKYIIPLLLWATWLSAQKKVGINTENPSQTLDINGTLRIESPKDLTNQSDVEIIPIGVDSKTKQVIPIADENYTPFKVVNYSFEVEKTGVDLNNPNATINEDWVNDIDLKVSTDKYTMIITQVSFINATTNSPVLVPIIGYSRLRGAANTVGLNTLYNAQLVDRGFIDDTNGEKYSGYMLAGQPQVMLYPDPTSKTWRFYADYPNVAPVSLLFEDEGVTNPPTRVKRYDHKPTSGQLNEFPIRFFDNYKWKITALIIDNNLIKSFDIKAINNQSSFGIDTDQPKTELTD